MRRVCGLDVHKDSVFCAIVDETGVIFQCKFGVLTDELEEMLSVLMEYHVQEVAMESTCVYWMPIWRVIEPYFPQKLVNPYFIKQLPGRKSDVKDAEWIATCLHKGLIRGSYVPNEHIQQLRQYDRRIFDLTAEISRKLTKLDMALQRCNIRLSTYEASRIRQKVLECIYQRKISKYLLLTLNNSIIKMANSYILQKNN